MGAWVICVSRSPALAPSYNLYFTAPALNLYLLASAFNLCLPVLRFTVKACYSYSVYLYKLQSQETERLSVSYDYAYTQRLLICTNLLSVMWEISKLQLFEISSQEILLITFCSFLFRNCITVILLFLLFQYDYSKRKHFQNILHAYQKQGNL